MTEVNLSALFETTGAAVRGAADRYGVFRDMASHREAIKSATASASGGGSGAAAVAAEDSLARRDRKLRVSKESREEFGSDTESVTSYATGSVTSALSLLPGSGVGSWSGSSSIASRLSPPMPDTTPWREEHVLVLRTLILGFDEYAARSGAQDPNRQTSPSQPALLCSPPLLSSSALLLCSPPLLSSSARLL